MSDRNSKVSIVPAEFTWDTHNIIVTIKNAVFAVLTGLAFFYFFCVVGAVRGRVSFAEPQRVASGTEPYVAALMGLRVHFAHVGGMIVDQPASGAVTLFFRMRSVSSVSLFSVPLLLC